MGKNFIETDIIESHIFFSDVENSAINLSSDFSIVILVNATLVIEMFQSIFLVGEDYSCGSFSVNGLNNFRISGFKLADIAFGIFDIFIDLINDVSNMLLFNKGVLFQKLRFHHLTSFNEDSGYFKDFIYLMDCSFGEVSTHKRRAFEFQIPFCRFQIIKTSEDFEIIQFKPWLVMHKTTSRGKQGHTFL